MAPPVHAHAEPDVPDGLLLELAVEPDGESYIWADDGQTCNEAMVLLAALATYGREQYPAIPRPRGSLEIISPMTSRTA